MHLLEEKLSKKEEFSLIRLFIDNKKLAEQMQLLEEKLVEQMQSLKELIHLLSKEEKC